MFFCFLNWRHSFDYCLFQIYVSQQQVIFWSVPWWCLFKSLQRLQRSSNMLRIVLESCFLVILLSRCFVYIYIKCLIVYLFMLYVFLTAPSRVVLMQRQISHCRRCQANPPLYTHHHIHSHSQQLPTLNWYNVLLLLNICVWLSPLSWHNNPTRLSPSAECRQFHLWSLEELTGDDGGQSRSFARVRRLKVADERPRRRWVALPTGAASATLKSD